MNKPKWKRIGKRFLWVLFRSFLFVVFLFTLLCAAIVSPPVQNYVVKKATGWLSEKFQSTVTLDYIYLSVPHNLVVDGFYLEDQNTDTLLALDHLKINVDMLALVNQKVHVNSILVRGLKANIQQEDSLVGFNYQFIIDAFADSTTAETEDLPSDANDSEPIAFHLDLLHLENISGRFHDKVIGQDAQFTLNTFSLGLDSLDVKQMRFALNDIALDGFSAQISLTKDFPEPTEDLSEDSAGGLPAISWKYLSTKNIELHYQHGVQQQVADVQWKNFEIGSTQLDLNQLGLNLAYIHSESLSAHYQFFEAKENSVILDTLQKPEPFKLPEILFPFDVKVGKIQLKDYAFTIDNTAVLDTFQTFNPKHVIINKLNLLFNDISVHNNNANIELASFSFQEKSGFSLQNLGFDLSLDEQSASLKNLRLQFPHSLLSANANFTFSDLSALINNPETALIKAEVLPSNLAMLDFVPLVSFPDSISSLFKQLPNLNFDAQIEGSAKDQLAVTLNSHLNEALFFKISASGNQLLSDSTRSFSLGELKLSTKKNALNDFVYLSTIAPDLDWPETLVLEGYANGTAQKVNSTWLLKSSIGTIKAVANVSNYSKDNPSYKIEASSTRLDLNRVLKSPSPLGPFAFEMESQGKGLDVKTALSKTKIQLPFIGYSGINYRNIKLEADLLNGRLNSRLDVVDSLIDFHAMAEIGWIDRLEVQTDLTLNGLDLYGMKLSNEDVRIKGNANVYLNMDSLNQLESKIRLYDLGIIANNQAFVPDDVLLNAKLDSQSTVFNMQSSFLSGNIESNLSAENIAHAFQDLISSYLSTKQVKKTYEPQREDVVNIKFQLQKSPFLSEVLLPGLETLDTANIELSFEPFKKSLEADILFPKSVYNGQSLDSFNIRASSQNERIDYRISTESIGSESFSIANLALYGTLANSELEVNIDVLDSLQEQAFHLGTRLKRADSVLNISVLPGVLINHKAWSIPANNELLLTKGNVAARQFELTRNNRAIRLLADSASSFGARVLFERFALGDFLDAFLTEEALLTGELNGNLHIHYPNDVQELEANLNIDKLHVFNEIIGNFKLYALQNGAQTKAELSLGGSGNTLQALFSQVGENSTVNINLDALKMRTLEVFSQGFIENSEGAIQAKVKANMVGENINVDGNIRFDGAAFSVPLLGTRYSMDKQNIALSEKQFAFKDFSILDNKGNKAVLRGGIQQNDRELWELDLRVSLGQFELLNLPESPEALFYGKLLLDSKVDVSGLISSPKVNADARIVGGSDITLVLPEESEKQITNQGGIDAFALPIDSGRTGIMALKRETAQSLSPLKGLELKSRLRIDKSTRTRVLMDANGDNYLSLNGDADLIFGIDPSGKISMSGRYEIDKGQYQMLFRSVVKRSFTLEKGSAITWLGDPLAANLNLKALHKVETSALALIQDQLPTTNQAELNAYKQVLPFYVGLKLGGDILLPDIGFDLSMPAEQQGVFNGQVQARINQLNQPEAESERNKQVFALLILGRFLANDPFASSGGGSGAIRGSMSDFLNAQLQNLSESYIKGIDLDLSLDSYEDYSSGNPEGRTELNVGVKKSFLNNRLNARVGGSVDLEGRNSQNQRAENLIGDVSVEYMLTSDGIWVMRGFRKNKFDGVVDGDIIETGVGLRFKRDYNRREELLKRPQETKAED